MQSTKKSVISYSLLFYKNKSAIEWTLVPGLEATNYFAVAKAPTGFIGIIFLKIPITSKLYPYELANFIASFICPVSINPCMIFC